MQLNSACVVSRSGGLHGPGDQVQSDLLRLLNPASRNGEHATAGLGGELCIRHQLSKGMRHMGCRYGMGPHVSVPS